MSGVRVVMVQGPDITFQNDENYRFAGTKVENGVLFVKREWVKNPTQNSSEEFAKFAPGSWLFTVPLP